MESFVSLKNKAFAIRFSIISPNVLSYFFEAAVLGLISTCVGFIDTDACASLFLEGAVADLFLRPEEHRRQNRHLAATDFLPSLFGQIRHEPFECLFTEAVISNIFALYLDLLYPL